MTSESTVKRALRSTDGLSLAGECTPVEPGVNDIYHVILNRDSKETSAFVKFGKYTDPDDFRASAVVSNYVSRSTSVPVPQDYSFGLVT